MAMEHRDLLTSAPYSYTAWFAIVGYGSEIYASEYVGPFTVTVSSGYQDPPAAELTSTPASPGFVSIGYSVNIDPGDAETLDINFYRVVNGQATSVGHRWLYLGTSGSIEIAEVAGSQVFAVVGEPDYRHSAYSNFVPGEADPAPPPPPPLPAAPDNLELYLADKDKVRLIWDNVSNNEDEFQIERMHIYQWGPMNWDPVGVVGADVTTLLTQLPYAQETYLFRVIAVNAGGPSEPAESQPISGIVVRSAAFNTSIQILRDDGEGAYTGPQWYDGNLNGQIDPGATTPFLNGTIDNGDERRYPLAYARSTPSDQTIIEVAIEFAHVGGAKEHWQVRGIAGEFEFELSEELVIGQTDFTAILMASDPVGETIDSFMLTIDWEMSTDGGGSWFGVGTTANRLYVIGSTAVAQAHETVVHLGAEAGKNKNPETETADLLAAIWAPFSTRNVIQPGDPTGAQAARQLTFWKTGEAEVHRTMEAMLANESGDGDCVAWSQLLVAVLETQGIVGARMVDVVSKYGDQFSIKRASLLIKNWIFADPPAGEPTFDGWTHRLGEFAPGTRILAQGENNNTSPESFMNHVIVAYRSNPNEDDVFLDPSYGGPIHSTQRKWEIASLSGFRALRHDPDDNNALVPMARQTKQDEQAANETLLLPFGE